jgi:hypothetical protein
VVQTVTNGGSELLIFVLRRLTAMTYRAPDIRCSRIVCASCEFSAGMPSTGVSLESDRLPKRAAGASSARKGSVRDNGSRG